MRRIVQANFSGDADHGLPAGPLSKVILDKFFRRRQGEGASRTGAPLAFPSAHVQGSAVTAAMERVEASLFAALRAVLAFDCLSDDEIRVLRRAMAVAKFADGEYVFEQGAEGDVFYLITGGEAEVLHYDPSDPRKEEVLLNVLGVSDCFGETALIKRAPRNASILAKGDLHVTFISRDGFEAALGRPLAEMKISHEHQDALRLAKLGAEPQEEVAEEEGGR